MNKKIIIFDLDGTLLNTLEDLTCSVNFMLCRFGYPQKNTDEIRNFVGDGVYKLIERVIPNGVSNPYFDDCVKIFKEHYKNNMYNKTSMYSGVESMLEKIKSENIITAVASNKFDLAVKELCEKYFGNLIDFAIGENEKHGIKKKPAPDMISEILNKFNLPSENALYVGDSEVDIQTAKNCQIECISVTWGFKTSEFLVKNGAKNIINSPDEIFKYIEIV